MRRRQARRPFRLAMAAAVIALAIGRSPAAIVASTKSAPPEFSYMRVGSPPIVDAKQWVLQGTNLSDGSCQYPYPSIGREIPPGGWVLRSIGINVSKCAMLMEEGAPAEPLSLAELDAAAGGDALNETLPTASKSTDGLQALATTSTRGAWQMVSWLDIVSLPTTRDRTQIHWTYNGSSVLSGNTAGWWWSANTGWILTANTVTQQFEADGAFRGQTTATFKNGVFCGSLQPVVWTYYWYNRVYGHANGTATISQSSDYYNSCLPLHVDILTGYN
jgi:hypothetical protein